MYVSGILDTTRGVFLEIHQIPIMGGLIRIFVTILFALSKENALFMHYVRKGVLP